MKSLLQQVSELMEYDTQLTGLRIFFATETDSESVEEAKELSNEELFESAQNEAAEWQMQLNAGKSVTDELSNNYMEVEEAIDEFDFVGVDTITPYWAGEREMDESSPELCGHQFARIHNRLMDEQPELEDTITPKLNFKEARMERFKFYAAKRIRFFDKLMCQARSALISMNKAELQRLRNKLFELRDSSFEVKLLLSMSKVSNIRRMNARDRRNIWLNDSRTKSIFEESRCLTAEQLKEGMAWFKEATDALAHGKNTIPNKETHKEEKAFMNLNIPALIKLYNLAILDELRDYYKMANHQILNGEPMEGTHFLRSLIEEKGLKLKQQIEVL